MVTEIGFEMLWIFFQLKISAKSTNKRLANIEKCMVTKMRLKVVSIPEVVKIFANYKMFIILMAKHISY